MKHSLTLNGVITEHGWTDKAELEQFLSEQLDGEAVHVIEDEPVIIKQISTARFGILAVAVVCRDKKGGLYATLVPHGAGREPDWEGLDTWRMANGMPPMDAP